MSADLFGTIAGKRVDVHYNLNRCRVGRDPEPGEACWRRGGVLVARRILVRARAVDGALV